MGRVSVNLNTPLEMSQREELPLWVSEMKAKESDIEILKVRWAKGDVPLSHSLSFSEASKLNEDLKALSSLLEAISKHADVEFLLEQWLGRIGPEASTARIAAGGRLAKKPQPYRGKLLRKFPKGQYSVHEEILRTIFDEFHGEIIDHSRLAPFLLRKSLVPSATSASSMSVSYMKYLVEDQPGIVEDVLSENKPVMVRLRKKTKVDPPSEVFSKG